MKKLTDLTKGFNAGHALNYFNVQPVSALVGIRELHIGMLTVPFLLNQRGCS